MALQLGDEFGGGLGWAELTYLLIICRGYPFYDEVGTRAGPEYRVCMSESLWAKVW